MAVKRRLVAPHVRQPPGCLRYLDAFTKCIRTPILVGALMVTVAFLLLCLRLLYDNMSPSGLTTADNLRQAFRAPPDSLQDATNDVTSFFRPLLNRGMMTFRNVCVEWTPEPEQQVVQFKNSAHAYNETKRVTVYGATWNGNKTFQVAGSGNSVWNYWNIHFRKGPIPESHVYHSGQTAYLISPTCPANLHHFWEDEFRPLFTVVSSSGQLLPEVPNQLLYRAPWDLEPDDLDCYDVRTYEGFLKLLGFGDYHDVFYHLDTDTCYEHGVFGLADFGGDHRSMVNYLLDRQGVSRETCPGELVTVIRRRNRQILNEAELIQMAKDTGFRAVQSVAMEELTLTEQMRVAACTTVLVGVQGAGLQWAVFMRPGSTLVEISWPERYWGTYFASWVTPYNIDVKTVHVKSDHVRVNWDSYQDNVRQGALVSAAEREELQNAPPKTALDNIWKWADVNVDAHYFKYAIIGRIYRRSNS